MSAGRKRSEKKVQAKVASWNVTSIRHTKASVNSAGAVNSAQSRSITSILYIIHQMVKHGVYVVCLQETKLENKVYHYDGGFVLVNQDMPTQSKGSVSCCHQLHTQHGGKQTSRDTLTAKAVR